MGDLVIQGTSMELFPNEIAVPHPSDVVPQLPLVADQCVITGRMMNASEHAFGSAIAWELGTS